MMGQLPEYDRHIQEDIKGAIARQPDPLPRGKVVAGVEREHYGPDPLSERARELEVAGFREPARAARGTRRVYVVPPEADGDEWESLTPLATAQKRIRALEEERATWKSDYVKVVSRYDDVLSDQQEQIANLTARLSRLRPVVRAAGSWRLKDDEYVRARDATLEAAVDALTPEDRAWVEGSP